MRETPLYQGEKFKSAQRPQAQLPTFQIPHDDGSAVNRAVEGLKSALLGYAEVKDYQKGLEAERERAELQSQFRQEMTRRANAQWGSEDSLFHEDGTINEEAVQGVVTDYQERQAATGKTFWLTKNRIRESETMQKAHGMLELDALEMVGRQERQNIERAFQDNFALHAERGDTGAAFASVANAVSRGIITPARGELMKLKLAKKGVQGAAAGGGGVTVGGQTFHGIEAQLAAEAVRSGETLEEGEEKEESKASDFAQQAEEADIINQVTEQGAGELSAGLTAHEINGGTEEPQSQLTAHRVEGGSAAVDTDGNSEARQLTANQTTGEQPAQEEELTPPEEPKEEEPQLTPSDMWFKWGDSSGVLKLMDPTEYQAALNSWQPFCNVSMETREDGSTYWKSQDGSPEAVERMAAHANEQGGASEDDCKMVVANLTLQAAHDNPHATPEQILKMFESSPIFATLGGGDAEQGKVRAMAIVQEFSERARLGTSKLTTDNIERMVDAKLAAGEIYRNRDWAKMERLTRALFALKGWEEPAKKTAQEFALAIPEDSKWDKPKEKDERGLAAWYELQEIYKKYRPQFRPGAEKMKNGDFEKEAAPFVRWFMGDSHIYQDRKREDLAAAKDWYLAETAYELRRNLTVDEKGKAQYKGYNSDIMVVQDVLKRELPEDLGVDAYRKKMEADEKNNEKLSEIFKNQAKNTPEKLKQMKTDYAVNVKEKQKKEEQAQKKAEREEEKRLRAEEKAKETAEKRRLGMERARPRQSGWQWNRTPSADGAGPTCTIPREQFKELTEKLGYDGSQVLYLRVGNTNVQVTGVNKKGVIELNGAALQKVQPRPKKGHTWRRNGNLEYSYYLKNAN